MQKGNHAFFQNRDCEYFPCHKVGDEELFNCLPCFCPLYALGDKCGGRFSYTEKGIKDCSGCAMPHLPGGYEHILDKMSLVTELAKKKD